ncbi:acyl-CoA dehydrogenase family protein [Novosphingobium sp. 1949]|uniref:Acyl-CoA dehydrogenase family protein n=1 Tax=Novosphingobium organovorum TaxID=2930092 RepID=A0ABT0BBL4_9SPHN|nr:acyl-CoA dehydrogenase family protein [Novosphingobium organovorum]MCJ2182452.1 acyl-CoA dehydrogenase family protein [Novosphingobium organovorum]
MTKAAEATDAFATLIETIRNRREEFDRLAHVPRDVVEQMKAAGIFRAATPKMFGGDAMPPADFLRMIDLIAREDGSAAWVAAFGSANTYVAALPVETQAKIYASGPDQVFAGGLYPLKPATEIEDGYVVSGRWRFASGCKGADWIGVGITIPGTAGTDVRMAVAPAADVEIIDNWEVFGLQGTGSHDTSVTEKFYPREWTCPRGGKSDVDEPLYRYPPMVFQAQVHAVCNIGMARAALDLVRDMAAASKMMPGQATLGDRAYFRTALALGEARWQSLSGFFYETAEEAWDMVVKTGEVSDHQRNLMRLAASYAAKTGAEIVQDCFRAAGMSVIAKTHRLQQILRDAMVVMQHASLNDSTIEEVGGFLAGASKGL